jgi:glycosyl transferase family 87
VAAPVESVAAGTGVTRAGLTRALELLGLPALAGTMVVLTIVEAMRRHELALDFRNVSPAIRGLAHGTDPYVLENVGAGGHFLWTVLAGWILLPFAYLPHGYFLVVALEVVGIAAAPVLLGVRDWRLIALALAWAATVNSVQSANITVLITVLIAAAWHDRDRVRGGLWAGLAVAVKLFAWPMLVWLAATRRWRALGVALAVQVFGLAITLPYISLRAYIHFEATVERIMAPQAITLDALTRDLGGSANAGRAVALVVGLALLWKGRKELGLVVVAMLVLSPVVWLHYFGLLVVPLALYSRSLVVWSIPILLFVVPGMGNGATWQTACALLVAGVAAGAAWFGRDRLQPTASYARPRSMTTTYRFR